MQTILNKLQLPPILKYIRPEYFFQNSWCSFFILQAAQFSSNFPSKLRTHLSSSILIICLAQRSLIITMFTLSNEHLH